jgi:tRNA(Ile)-lysidine synthase
MPRVSLVNRVAKGLREGGVRAGARLLVAVSGGVDSMVLLDALARLRTVLDLHLCVAHVQHGLRVPAGDADAAFVTSEAARRGLPVRVIRLDPTARRRGDSVQAWAREARYQGLEAVRREVRASRVLTAHTQDDQAETVLLNLLRGTGPRGLAGMPSSRDRILRPLLSVSRREVEAYATRHRVLYREDASNASDAYRRNHVRHHLLPLLATTYNPRIVESLATLAALLREEDAALAAAARALMARAVRAGDGEVRLDVKAFRSAPPAIARRGFQAAFQLACGPAARLTRRHLDACLGLLRRGGAVRLPGEIEARQAGSEIRLEAAPAGRAGRPARHTLGLVPLRLGAWIRWPPLGCELRVRRVRARLRPISDGWTAYLSPTLLEARLAVRGWRPGDRFRPLGAPGRKKLQDFFVDAKVPREQRGRVPLLVAGEEIAWVAGQRIAEEFRWPGQGAACLVEVRFPEGGNAVPTGAAADPRG